MAANESIPIHEKFVHLISQRACEEERRREENRKESQQDVVRTAKEALRCGLDHDGRPPHRSVEIQPPRGPKSGQDRAVLEVNGPTLLPTPPSSPESSRSPEGKIVAPSLPKINTHQELAKLKTSLKQQEHQLRQLNSKLDDAQSEVKRIREEKHEAANESLLAILNDQDERLNLSKKREIRLVNMIKEKEQTIKDLEEEIDTNRKQQRKLQAMLAEVERRDDRSEQSRTEARAANSMTGEQKAKHTTKNIRKTPTWQFRRTTSKTTSPLREGLAVVCGEKALYIA